MLSGDLSEVKVNSKTTERNVKINKQLNHWNNKCLFFNTYIEILKWDVYQVDLKNTQQTTRLSFSEWGKADKYIYTELKPLNTL